MAEIVPSGLPVPVGNPAPEGLTLPPAKLASPRLKLETIAHVRRELKRVYTQARRGEVKMEHAGKLAYLLDLMSRMIERSELEQRVIALEAQSGPK